MLKRIIALTLLLLPATLVFAQPASVLPEPVARALAQAGIPESAVGVYVHEIGADQPVLSIGAERALNPASTMKLVTTYAGLELLGPAFVWNTDVLTDGTLTQDVLNGNLYIKGAGDPKLTVESFWLLLRNLRARGIREIRGDLILDRRLFAEEVQDPGAFDDQPTRPYNTGPSALLVNFKAVTLQFIPDAATRTVRITVEPPLPQVQIINNLKIADGPCGDWVGKLRAGCAGQRRFGTPRLQWHLCAGLRRRHTQLQRTGPSPVRRRAVYPILERPRRRIQRTGARRRHAGSGAQADYCAFIIAFGNRPRRQQILEQCDGATAVSFAGHEQRRAGDHHHGSDRRQTMAGIKRPRRSRTGARKRLGPVTHRAHQRT